ncbi:MAG: DIP1984 family protein [Anaerolineae bacterium]|nr:DIP1984 family protein [Anaerolineae bacterium]
MTKLAEALILRADCQKRLTQLEQRLLRNAKVQQGDQPTENPQALLGEINQVAGELTDWIQRINRTNIAVSLGDKSLADALAQRDVLKLQQGIYRRLAEAASIVMNQYSRSEVRFESTVDVATIQKRADELAQAYRDLDAQIQAVNWTADLL